MANNSSAHQHISTSAHQPINPESAGNLLIVEDHVSLRESLANWLADLFPNIVIHQAGTGEEGVALAGRISPEVILMDIGLPGINGIEATRELLRRGIHSQVVVLTIQEGIAYRESALNAGAREFITKREMYSKLPPVIQSILNTNDEYENDEYANEK